MEIDEDYCKKGLTETAVSELLHKYGLNEIVRNAKKSDWILALHQFINPLVLLLIGAVALTLVIGHESDAFLIGAAIIINAFLGFIQERRATRSLEALRSLVSVQSSVLRDGKRMTIDARNLVPGDVVFLNEGERVSADGILVEAVDLAVNEAILTGESLPVSKNTVQDNHPDQESTVLMGTLVYSGWGKMVVTKTGASTEMGSIARSSERLNIKTPLETRIAKLAIFISITVVIVALIVFVGGWTVGRDWKEMFTIAVALVVSATPEGLVIALTVILAVGAERMMRRKALLRKLVAAETLGSVTHVCVDKTGTLTQGLMKVIDVDFVDVAAGYRVSLLANDMRDPTEVARIEWARQFYSVTAMGKYKADLINPEKLIDESKRDESIAFSTERRFLAVRYGMEVMMVGAPDLLLSMSKLSKISKKEWEARLIKWASEGKRVLCFLNKICKSENEAKLVMANLRSGEKEILNWLGIMAFSDPVRPGVRQTLKIARAAGIKVVVITGDYRETALAVMRSLGIYPKSSEIIEGWELEKMSDGELGRAVRSTVLFARTRPAQKLRIVQALQKQGAVVGMMGDGVNDAPALAAADIGMVVGEATDLAKDAADLVLLDSNFATIVAAIEEGRGIYDNIRKVVTFLLGMAFSEVLVVLGSLLFGWELALTAVQILWINLVTDGLPYMALTVDPKDANVLKRKPIDSKLPLVDSKLLVMIVGMSLLNAGLALVTYLWWLPLGLQLAQTGVFLVISLGTLGYAFACRSLDEPIWVEKPWGNWFLMAAVVIGIWLTYLAVSMTTLKDLLGTQKLDVFQWIWVVITTLIILVGAETIKIIMNRISK